MEKTIEKREKYDPIKLENLKRFLENRAIKGSARYYEIHIDNLKIVEKTNALDDFDTYEDYLYDGVKEIIVQIYTTSLKSPRPLSRHVFYLEEEKKEEQPKAQPLSGTEDIKTQITEQVKVEKERWDAEQVRKDLAATQQKLQEAENYIEILTKQIEEKGKNENMADLGTTLIKDVLPQFLGNKTTDIKGLAGSLEKKEEGETTYRKKTESAPALSEDDERYLSFVRELEEKFDEDEMDKVLDIIRALAEKTENISTVADLLNIKHEPKTENNEKI